MRLNVELLSAGEVRVGAGAWPPAVEVERLGVPERLRRPKVLPPSIEAEVQAEPLSVAVAACRAAAVKVKDWAIVPTL